MRLRERPVRWGLAFAVILAAGVMVPAHPFAQSAAGVRRVTATAAGDVRDWDTQLTRMVRDGQLRSRRVDADPIVEGRTHERLEQYHRGVRVFGGELVRQADHGQTVSVFGALYAGIDIGVEPALGPSDAAAIIAKMTGAASAAAPELVVLPRDEGGYVLAYRVRVMTESDLVVYFVDAATGGIALQYSNLETVIGTGLGVRADTKKVSTTLRSGAYLAIDGMRPPAIFTFDLKGNTSRVLLYLNGLVTLNDSDVASDADNTWTDPCGGGRPRVRGLDV